MKTLDEVIKAFEQCKDDKCYECAYHEKVHADSCIAKRESDALHYLKAYKDDRGDLTALRAYWAEMHKDVRQKAEVTEEDPDGDHAQLEKCRTLLQDFYRNDPINWDELMRMEGKPVFLEQYWYPMEDETGTTEDEVETDKYWAVIDNVQSKRIHFVGKRLNMGMTKSDLNPNKNGGWQAYRKERS